MIAKYSMTVEQNIFVAKRNIVDYIWKSARLEGIDVSYPDTEAIYNGITVPNLKVEDIVVINNLKHSWQFVLESIGYLVDYPFFCEINRLVSGGITSKPETNAIKINEVIADMRNVENPTERAISLMLHCMRSQLFFNGNIRTSMLLGNQVMISNGVGIISVPIEHQTDFVKLLSDFYESNKIDDIKHFVYDKCIDGISFEN